MVSSWEGICVIKLACFMVASSITPEFLTFQVNFQCYFQHPSRSCPKMLVSSHIFLSSNCSDLGPLHDSIRNLVESTGVTVIVAAGNDNTNLYSFEPAKYYQE